VRRTGDKARVNVQLIDAETGGHVWADRLESDLTSLAEAQSDITGRLARTLGLELVDTVGHWIEQEKAADPNARDLIMRGWAVYHRRYSAASLQEARQLFERAIELDTGSVDARIGIARVLAANVVEGRSSTPQQDAARAEQLLREALERDPNRSMAHEAMGIVHRAQNRLTEAVIELETAIALDPNAARAFLQLGNALLFMGQPEAAIPYIEKAIRLNPYDPKPSTFYLALGLCRICLGQVDEAINLLRKARAANSRYAVNYLYLAGALGLRGDLDEARISLGDAIRLEPKINSLARSFYCN